MLVSVTSSKLPRIVDGQKFCQQGISVSGVIGIEDLLRLEGLLSRLEGSVDVDVVFGLDEQRRRIIKGSFKSTLPLICQRCLHEMPWALNGGFELALVSSEEQASRLPRDLDAVVVDDGEIDLYAVVEDEMLLALPLAAHHDVGACLAPGAGKVSGHTPDPVVEKPNPFQVLANLKITEKPRNDDSC